MSVSFISTGTNTDANTLSGSLDGHLSGDDVPCQDGIGKGKLTNSSTFVGSTSITGGTLVLTNASALQNSPLTLNTGNLSPIFASGILQFRCGLNVMIDFLNDGIKLPHLSH